MKIILSRKGFDSANGGILSPIMPDGTMISFPIPCEKDEDTYNDLFYGGSPYLSILTDLGYNGETEHCHVDPDLDPERRNKNIDGWFPAFGQMNSSSVYLTNNDVSVGDIFLFFGNFHCVEKRDGHYKYVRKSGDFYKDRDLQIIWGYLQIGEILVGAQKQREVYWHPHSLERRVTDKTNIIFKAARQLSLDCKLPGAGLLAYDKKRVLTEYGQNKATWKKNSVYDIENICSKRKNNAKDPEMGIYYSGIWQELVLKATDNCTAWAKNIIL